MKYNNKTRETRSNENKKRIIACASKLINEKGFDNVSISQITEEAHVSKGAFYIHFKSKEDLLLQEINIFYDEFKLDDNEPAFLRLKHFLLSSITHIKESGLKMCQEWFSNAIKGSFHGKSKLAYDRKTILEIIKDEKLSDEIVAAYYGALNLWCFSDGQINPEDIISRYLDEQLKEKIK